MNLPQIQVIGLQPPQRLLQHLHREILIAAVGADLGHQEHAVAPALQRFAHPVFGLAAMIFPAVVEEVDPAVDRLVDDPDRRLLVLRVAEVMSAEASAETLRRCAGRTAASEWRVCFVPGMNALRLR